MITGIGVHDPPEFAFIVGIPHSGSASELMDAHGISRFAIERLVREAAV
jgi:hypothetical protein